MHGTLVVATLLVAGACGYQMAPVGRGDVDDVWTRLLTGVMSAVVFGGPAALVVLFLWSLVAGPVGT